MVSWTKGDDRVAVVQMNAELRNAQLELLSAECATDRLRLRFSIEDVARHGHRDVLRKALATASSLHEYFSNIARQVSDSNLMTLQPIIKLDEGKINEAIQRLSQYFRDQTERYRPEGIPLSNDQHIRFKPYFPLGMLSGVRIVKQGSRSISEPPFYREAKNAGLTNLPEVAHMASMTFDDVIVFQGEITDRRLFHALVHSVQFRVLGVERYAELFVKAFLRVRSHVSVPLEMHAFKLESKFADEPDMPFPVEEMVRLWTNQGRY